MISFRSFGMKLSHSSGYTDLCYDNTGGYILTCGSDGDVRIWKGVDDNEPMSYKVGERAHALQFAKGRVFVATESNSIYIYTFPDGVSDGILTRFTAPVTHIDVSPDGQTLVAGSSDFSIKVIRITTNTSNVLQGHEAPILSVSVDPALDFVASSSCDGSVRVWNIKEETCVKKWDVIPPSNDFTLSKTLARLSWTPKGEHLIVPVDKELVVYNRDTWEEAFRFNHSELNEMISTICLHSSGDYVAASCIDGSVFVWNWETKSCIHKMKHEKGSKICGLKWNPNGSMELAYTDELGYVGTFVQSDKNQSEATDEIFAPLSPDNLDSTEDGEAKLSELLSDDDDDDVLPNISRPFRPSLIDDENSLEIDIGAIKASLEPKIFNEHSSQDDMQKSKMADKSGSTIIKYTGPEISKRQPSFQSGSTPIHFSHRYLVWNSVGIVRSYNTDEENSIEVEFHDTATHHAMHFPNNCNYVLGDLSKEAVIFASHKDLDFPSKLICHHFSSWDDNKEWTVDLGDEEEFQVVCLGSGWLAAATSFRSVRLFMLGGIQREILCIPGDVVTMATHRDRLCIVYHQSIAVGGDQNMSMIIYDVGERIQVTSSPIHLPLGPKSMLSWLGFSDQGSPCHMDSSGVLRMFSGITGGLYTQIINTRDHIKGKSDHHFVVGVDESQQHVRSILCKGSRYPQTVPRPAVVILPITLPFCEMFTEKSKLEESYWKHHLMSGYLDLLDGEEKSECTQAVEKIQRETLMKMFALACKADREFRAAELTSLMSSQHALQLAIKYATRLKRMNLAERIGEIAEKQIYDRVKTTLRDNGDENVPSHRRHRIEDSPPLSGQNEEDDDQECLEPNPILLAQQRKRSSIVSSQSSTGGSAFNPFKKVANDPKESPTCTGTTAFDNMKKVTPGGRKPLGERKASIETTSKQKSKQTTLFKKSVATPSPEEREENRNTKPESVQKTGFQLWLQSNKDRLKEENPDLDDMAVVKIAVKAFRTLPTEEKQIWNKPKQLHTNGSDAGQKKRKIEDDDQESSEVLNKNKKADSTNKLSGFAFNKL